MKLPIKLPPKVTRFFGKALLKLKGNKPEICVITGLLLGGAAIVTTGIQTWKGKEQLSQDVEDIRDAKEDLASAKAIDPLKEEKPGDRQNQMILCKRSLMAKRIDFGKDILKCFWLPGLLAIGAGGFVWGGRILFRKEIGTLAALLTAANESYNRLYKSIRDRFGDEVAQELVYGVENIEVKDEKTGEVTTVQRVDKSKALSQYAFIFDPGQWDEENQEWYFQNTRWNQSKLQNFSAISSVQREATDLMCIRGWLTWGEVAERLGAQPDESWYHVGWVWKPGQNNAVEFRVLEGPYQLPFNRAFTDMSSPQNVCIIEPNVENIDYIFKDISKYDKRYGRSAAKRRKLPSTRDMFGEDMARKLQEPSDEVYEAIVANRAINNARRGA